MKISYDYNDMIEELKSDIDEGLIDADGKIFIVRETIINESTSLDGIAAYSAIVDYYFDTDDIDGIDGEWMTVKGVLYEMEEINKVV